MEPSHPSKENSSMGGDRLRRWEREAQFFDEWADTGMASIEPLSQDIIRRYRNSGTLYHKEYRFWMMGDITNKLILEVGYGSGMNAVLMASFGAQVVGVDISPKAIELAKHRARLSGLADRCTFLCFPLELAHDFGGPFDIVWGGRDSASSDCGIFGLHVQVGRLHKSGWPTCLQRADKFLSGLTVFSHDDTR